MAFDDTDNLGLVLGLGFGLSNELKKATVVTTTLKPEQQFFSNKESENLGPSLILSLSGEPCEKKVGKDDLYRQDSVASSISHVTTVKREREIPCTTTTRVVVMNDEDDDDDGGSGSNAARKKLRLTKAQSVMLEESFKHRSSLNPKQKQELAKELNLRPRQVEVWFQNRRARTKLKQTEADCEFLKKCCETLAEENRRLQKELQELKALKVSSPFYNMPPATAGKLTICPSCEQIAGEKKNPRVH